MKNLIKYLFISIAFIACNNDDKPEDPISQLPPATQIGANKIGCLVNGVPFTDSGLMNNFYQLVDGEYFLGINWEQDTSTTSKFGQIGMKRIEIVEGQTYILNKSGFLNGDFTGAGGTFYTNIEPVNGQFETNESFTGKIHFTKFDKQNQIMSGTFEFQAQEIFSGETISITDGRFDLTFTN